MLFFCFLKTLFYKINPLIKLSKKFHVNLLIISPELVDIIDNSPLSVNELQYLENENILFTLLSDLNITKRVETFIKNKGEIVLSWNKEELTPQ